MKVIRCTERFFASSPSVSSSSIKGASIKGASIKGASIKESSIKKGDSSKKRSSRSGFARGVSVAGLLALTIFVPTFATPFQLQSTAIQAEEVFSWTDKSGRKVFGTRPPASAGKVAPVKKITLGRYSSDKVLRSLGKNPENSRSTKSSSSAAGGQSRSEPIAQFDSIELLADEVQIERNAELRVTACSVTVRNDTPVPAGDVSVAFEFADGTLIPAIGPNEIGAQSAATFSIPKELSPLKLKIPATDVEKLNLPPRVIVHGFAAPGSLPSAEQSTKPSPTPDAGNSESGVKEQ